MCHLQGQPGPLSSPPFTLLLSFFQQPCLQYFLLLPWFESSGLSIKRSWKHLGLLLCLPRLFLGRRPARLVAACSFSRDQPPVPLWQVHMLGSSWPTLSGLQKWELRTIPIHLLSCNLSGIGFIAIPFLFRDFFLESKYFQFISIS